MNKIEIDYNLLKTYLEHLENYETKHGGKIKAFKFGTNSKNKNTYYLIIELEDNNPMIIPYYKNTPKDKLVDETRFICNGLFEDYLINDILNIINYCISKSGFSYLCYRFKSDENSLPEYSHIGNIAFDF